MDPDPDPGGPKTYGSDGSGFGSGSVTLGTLFFFCFRDDSVWTAVFGVRIRGQDGQILGPDNRDTATRVQGNGFFLSPY
jgi:hypothetical protein